MSERSIVVLIHGIRTAAWWQSRVAALLESEANANVIPLKYGYFDVLRFWCPLGPCRNGPIERLRKQIEGVREQFRGRHLTVLAHSYGTYALSRILLDNPYFKFDRIILCGSIIPENYEWERVENQILSDNKRDAIINECGKRDVWPVLAKCTSWGYGASGTYGFGSFNVRDRFHNNRHSDFFDPSFVRKYWVPAVAGEPPVFSDADTDEGGTPAWYGILRMPFKWAVLGVPIIAGFAILSSPTPGVKCPSGKELIESRCIDVRLLKSRKEIAGQISTLLKDINATLNIKTGDLFPAMREFQANPSEQGWRSVIHIAEKLYLQVERSLDHITTYDSYLIEDGAKVILIASDARVVIDNKYWKAFNEAKGHFKGRVTLLTEMRGAAGLPKRERVADWLDRLEQLHEALKAALVPLSKLLDEA
jgi:pimeloyl-ACP methyl ester carboxylesterase